MNWIFTRTRAFLQMLYAPDAAYKHDLRGPSCLIPLLILGVAFTLISAAQSPYHGRWMQHQLESAGAPPEQITATMDLLRRSDAWRAAGVPLYLLLRWALFALLLWLAGQLILGQPDFQHALTIVAFSYLPILLRDSIICLVLSLRSEEVLMRADGLNVALGLNLVFPAIPPPWSSLAGNLNLFEAWFVFLLVEGVARATGSRRQRALAVVLPCWVFSTLTQFGLASLGQKMTTL